MVTNVCHMCSSTLNGMLSVLELLAYDSSASHVIIL